jgi:hypothetical protein
MTLVYHNKSFGNLRIYDIDKYINVNKLVPTFDKLKIDPYVKEGFRRKHITRYNSRTLKPSEEQTILYQSKTVNPTHGDIERVYPKFITDEKKIVEDILQNFKRMAHVPYGEEILFQAQRITCTEKLEGLPSVEDWHRDGVKTIGIICVSRHNIKGGINEFKVPNTKIIIEKLLLPGYFAVFDDTEVMHRVTPINPEDKKREGYRDVILVAYPSKSMY